MKTGITIIEARYVHSYIIELTFSDGKKHDVDCESQVMAQKIPV